MSIDLYLRELQEEFKKDVDTKDPVSLQKWFAKHPYLSVIDHAIVAQCSVWNIQNLKRRAKLTGSLPKTPVKSKARKAIRSLVVPENWNTKEWLEENIKKYSAIDIAIAAGVSDTWVGILCKQYGIKIPARRHHNPCYTREWVYEHYVVRRMTQEQCAQLAGICTQAFGAWLAKFQIPSRSVSNYNNIHWDIDEADFAWVKKIFYELHQQDIVRKVKVKTDHFHVRFRDYSWETYYFKGEPPRKTRCYQVTKDMMTLRKLPEISLEYETELDGTSYPAHIIIKPNQWKKASFLEKRLALHEMTRTINRRGWVPLDFPQRILEEDLEKYRWVNPAKYLNGDVFDAFPQIGSSPGYSILYHFFGLEEFWDKFLFSPKRVMNVLNKIAESTNDITTREIIRMACVHYSKPYDLNMRTFDSRVYSIILQRLGIRGAVLDLHPAFGQKAMACALAGVKYLTPPDERFQRAIDAGFADFIGLNYEVYDGGPVDLIINDKNFGDISLQDALQYASQTKNMLHFVKRTEKSQILGKVKPTRTIKIRAEMFRKSPDYLFLF